MQTESNSIPQKTSLLKNSHNNTQDSQHGFYEPDEHFPRQLHAAQGRAQPRRSASSTSSSASSTRSSNGARERPLRRLSPSSRQESGSPVDRIIQHEKDLTYLPNKRTETRPFTVIQRVKNLGSARLAIEDFPNGSHSTFASL